MPSHKVRLLTEDDDIREAEQEASEHGSSGVYVLTGSEGAPVKLVENVNRPLRWLLLQYIPASGSATNSISIGFKGSGKGAICAFAVKAFALPITPRAFNPTKANLAADVTGGAAGDKIQWLGA